MTTFGTYVVNLVTSVALFGSAGVACGDSSEKAVADQPVADLPLAGTIGDEAFTVDGVYARWVGRPLGLEEQLSISAVTPTPTCNAPALAADARGVTITLDSWPLPTGSVLDGEDAAVTLTTGQTGSGTNSVRVEVIAATAEGGTIALRSGETSLGQVEGRLSFTICPHVPASTWELTGAVGGLDLKLLGSVQMLRLSEPDQTRVVASNHVFWCRDVLDTGLCPPGGGEPYLRELTIVLPGHATGTYAVQPVADPPAGGAAVTYFQLDSNCVIDDTAHPLGVQGMSGTITVDTVDETAYGDISLTFDVTMGDGSHLTGTAHAVSCP